MDNSKEINARILELEARLQEQESQVEQILAMLEPWQRQIIEDHLHLLSEFCSEYALLVFASCRE